MSTLADATRAQQQLARAMRPDPDGVYTIAGAKRLYVSDEIELDEFERRVELFLSGRPIAVLQPGEFVISRHSR